MAETYHYQSNKLKEIKTTLNNVVENYKKNPEQVAELLSFKGQFYEYSLNNAILINTQNPYSTFVASFRDWNAKGYHVKKGQHGIKVLYPIRTELIKLGEKDGKIQYRRLIDATPQEKKLIKEGKLKTVVHTRFGIGNVFDISQTNCPPEDYPKIFNMGYSSEQHAELYKAVKAYSQQKGFPVQEEDLQSISLRGNFTPKTKIIRINEKLNDTEKLSTLTHELGHALMHSNPEASKLPTEIKELEADGISIMLQKYVGIKLTETRKSHFVQNYNQCKKLNDFNFEDALKTINSAYYTLHKELEPLLSPIKPIQKVIPIRKKSEVQKNDSLQNMADRTETPKNKKQSYKDYKYNDSSILDNIKRGISILSVAQAMGYTPEKIGNYYSLKEHDSLMIYPETNSFYRFSTGIGGSVIDFVMHFGGLTKQEAIKTLKEKYSGRQFEYTPTKQTINSNPSKPKKEFTLPQKFSGKFTRAFAYLVKTRCIDSAVVQKCIKDGLLYEDNKHNVVFVGKDKDGNTEYATRHTTLTGSDFKRDVAGSRQDIGFFINNNTDRLYVCEAPIDALSIMSLMKQQGKPITNASYLATCGTGKDAALFTRLNDNPQVKEVILANDNDVAGQQANKKILDKLQTDYPHIHTAVLKPKHEKDINDCLRKRVNRPKENPQEMEVER